MAEDFDDDDLEELARLEGKSVEEIRKELLRERLLRGKKSAARVDDDEPAPRPRALARRREEVPVRRHSVGSLVERDEDESAAEAAERWYQEESQLIDGVHGAGGQTAGGIFGAGTVATPVYDPDAHARADQRLAHFATARTLQVIEQLERRLSGGIPVVPMFPPGTDPRALPRRR